MIEHQVADADVLRRHHVRAQQPRKVARLQLAARGAVDNVMLGREARQNRCRQARPGLRWNLRVRAELFAGKLLQARLVDQFELQAAAP